jgi:hypothetical protein
VVVTAAASAAAGVESAWGFGDFAVHLIPPPLTEADRAYYSAALLAQAQRPEQRVEIDYTPEATAGRANTIG